VPVSAYRGASMDRKVEYAPDIIADTYTVEAAVLA